MSLTGSLPLLNNFLAGMCTDATCRRRASFLSLESLKSNNGMKRRKEALAPIWSRADDIFQKSQKFKMKGGTMMKPHVMLVAVAALAVLSTPGISQPASQAPAREGPTLILGAKVPLTGVQGRIDHFTFDPKRRLTIFSGLGNNTIEMVNNFEGKHVKTITGLDEPQGPLYVPEFDKLFVANAGNGVVNVYDAKAWNLLRSISFGEESDTDNLRYDEATKQVFVGIKGGIGIIDAATEARVGDLKGSGGHTESFQLEKNGSRVFANVPNDNGVVNVIDRKTGALAKWDLNGRRSMRRTRRIWSSCSKFGWLMITVNRNGQSAARSKPGRPILP
jgi:hypothetical protein